MAARIFLVEDDDSFRHLLAEYLGLLGYPVVEFGSGEELLSALDDCSTFPDLVISDLNLGRLTGMQLLRELRHRCPRPRVILMTAFGSRSMPEEAAGAGAVGYLDKPFEFDTMQELIERVLTSGP